MGFGGAEEGGRGDVWREEDLKEDACDRWTGELAKLSGAVF